MTTSAVSPDTKFIIVEVDHLNDEKYYEGERINRDPGDSFVINWISKYGKEYRDAWYKSKCKDCLNWKLCGKEAKIFCERFKGET